MTLLGHSQVTSTSIHPSTSNSNSSSFQNTHPHTRDRKQGKTKSVAVTRVSGHKTADLHAYYEIVRVP